MSDAPDGRPVLVPVLPNHRFDIAALERYLAAHLDGFRAPLAVRQFQGGQSNPTFHLATPDAEYVLRKKPPGRLLPSAHAVEREFQVQRALAGSAVPVAPMLLLCEDETVIGTAFYVMAHVEGRVFTDRLLPGVPPGERGAMYDAMNDAMAALHQVDWRAAGLEGFGRPHGYVARQIARWTKQYVASDVGDVPAMDRLAAWLQENLPAGEETAIAHGDFRLGNLIYHPTEPRILAVLDWELATIGHPLADLAYNCLIWHLPPELTGIMGVAAPGLPDERDYVATYCRRTGREAVPELPYFIAFSMFRWAAIAAGVQRRALDGNAADARGMEAGAKYRGLAERGWEIAQRA
jgi:aminoglycoside phosphotransferase (APT) family kinase protein